MVTLINSFRCLRPARVLLIGDLLLDTYTNGFVQRMSAEAPVPILDVQEIKDSPGGAGNVALNLKALNADVLFVGRVGDDDRGAYLLHLLREKGVGTEGISVQKGAITPSKHRFMADSQQLLRVDKECHLPLNQDIEKRVMQFISEHIGECAVVTISDYNKGFFSKSLLKFTIELASKYGIPTLVDPKGENFKKYYGATLIKPNYREALVASKLEEDATLSAIARALLTETASDKIMVTRSEHGITLFEREGQRRSDFPVRSREVRDVTGAGDTVLAMTAMVLASPLNLREGLELSNIAASIAIERVGCVAVSLSEVAERLLEIDMRNKVFDEKTLLILEEMLQGKKLTILGVNTKEGLSNVLLTSIQKLAKRDDSERFMIYPTDPDPDPHMIALLTSLREVDFVAARSNSLTFLSKKISPSHIYALDEGGSLLPITSTTYTEAMR